MGKFRVPRSEFAGLGTGFSRKVAVRVLVCARAIARRVLVGARAGGAKGLGFAGRMPQGIDDFRLTIDDCGSAWRAAASNVRVGRVGTEWWRNMRPPYRGWGCARRARRG